MLEDFDMYQVVKKNVNCRDQFVPVAENAGSNPFFKNANYDTNIADHCKNCRYLLDPSTSDMCPDIPVYGKDGIPVVKSLYGMLPHFGLVTDKPVIWMSLYGLEFKVLWDFAQKFVTAGVTMFVYYKMWQWDLDTATVDTDLRKTLS